MPLKNITPHGVYSTGWPKPAEGECVCGEIVSLTAFTNTCDRCGRDYNMSGELLAPRECWGEETNEHWSDCL